MLMTAPPPSCNWQSSAPAAQSKASVSSMKTSYAFGSAMTGTSTMAWFNLKRASCPIAHCHFALGPVNSFCHETKPTVVPYSFEGRLSLAPTACQPLSEIAWTTGGIPCIHLRSLCFSCILAICALVPLCESNPIPSFSMCCNLLPSIFQLTTGSNPAFSRGRQLLLDSISLPCCQCIKMNTN